MVFPSGFSKESFGLALNGWFPRLCFTVELDCKGCNIRRGWMTAVRAHADQTSSQRSSRRPANEAPLYQRDARRSRSAAAG